MPIQTELTGLTRILYGLKTKPDIPYDYYKRGSTWGYPEKRKLPRDKLFNPTQYTRDEFLAKTGLINSSNGMYWDLLGASNSSNASLLVSPPFGVDLRNRIKSQKVNLAQTIAEYGQARSLTVDLIGRLMSIRKRFFSIKPGDILNTLGGTRYRGRQGLHIRDGVPTQVLSSNTLAFSYGIRPIIGDIDGLLTETRNRITSESFVKRVEVSKSDSRETSFTSVFGIKSVHIRDSAFAKYTHVCWYELDRLSLESTASRFGFLNPAALAWELIPWSFVVDYLFRVGDIIQSLDALTGVSKIAVTTTTRSRSMVVKTPVHGGLPSFKQARSTARSIGAVPSIMGDLKRMWEPNLTFARYVNLAALLRQSTPPTTRLWRI